MLVVLTTSKGPIAVNAESVRSVMPNKADSACTIFFDENHAIEVIGTLAKVSSKLRGDAPAPKSAPPKPGGPVRR